MDISNIINSILTISGMGLIFGVGLGYAAIKFHVPQDPKLDLIKEALPGANCGGCGFAGCEAFAGAILDGTAKPNGCPVGGVETTTKVSEILGVKAEILEKTVAFIRCKGGSSVSTFKYDYYGLNDCEAIMQLADGGSKACTFGCLGGGSCVNACKFGAISIQDGIAKIDSEKCTACGMCKAACPKKLIEMIPYKNKIIVGCFSNDAGKAVRSNCSVGCIGCKMCVKACEFEAIIFENNLAKIDYEKCTQCGKCKEKCPTKAII